MTYSVIFASPVGQRTPGFCTMGKALHAASSLGPLALWMAAQNAIRPLAKVAAPQCRSTCQSCTILVVIVMHPFISRELTPVNTTTSKKPVIGCRLSIHQVHFCG